MNRTPATRYRIAARLAFISEPPPLSSSAKADDPVIRNRRELTNGHGVLDAPPARGMTTCSRASARRSLGFFLADPPDSVRDREAAEDIDARDHQGRACLPVPLVRAVDDHGHPDREQRTNHD